MQHYLPGTAQEEGNGESVKSPELWHVIFEERKGAYDLLEEAWLDAEFQRKSKLRKAAYASDDWLLRHS